ncbi:hypothetical protein MBLNU230_g3061t1 [Neophaeotheca triangularis]
MQPLQGPDDVVRMARMGDNEVIDVDAYEPAQVRLPAENNGGDPNMNDIFDVDQLAGLTTPVGEEDLTDNANAHFQESLDHGVATEMDRADHKHLNYTVDTCLQTVMEMFPDILPKYVEELYNNYGGGEVGEGGLPPQERAQRIAHKIADREGDYPKRETARSNGKRKRADSPEASDFSEFTSRMRGTLPLAAKDTVRSILTASFPSLTVQCIKDTFAKQKQLFPTYVALSEIAAGSAKKGIHRTRDNHASHSGTAKQHASELASAAGPEIEKEYNAAVKAVQEAQEQRIAKQQKQKADDENKARAREENQLVECQACFEKEPMNRSIHCDGEQVHYICYDCAEIYVKTMVGDQSTRVFCSGHGCGLKLATSQLRLLPNQKDVERLENLLQEEELRNADIPGLEGCPFCSYQAILEDGYNHFQCENPRCGELSCRICKKKSHIPLTCKEVADNNKVSLQNQIAEAMSSALIRNCNKCKTAFLKAEGCNKMACVKCGNLQCYVCSESIRDYTHFDQRSRHPAPRSEDGNKKCAMYDVGGSVDHFHHNEVKKAEKKAREEALANNPELQDQDLRIEVDEPPPRALGLIPPYQWRQMPAPGAAPRRPPVPLPNEQLRARFQAHHRRQAAARPAEAPPNDDDDLYARMQAQLQRPAAARPAGAPPNDDNDLYARMQAHLQRPAAARPAVALPNEDINARVAEIQQAYRHGYPQAANFHPGPDDYLGMYQPMMIAPFGGLLQNVQGFEQPPQAFADVHQQNPANAGGANIAREGDGGRDRRDIAADNMFQRVRARHLAGLQQEGIEDMAREQALREVGAREHMEQRRGARAAADAFANAPDGGLDDEFGLPGGLDDAVRDQIPVNAAWDAMLAMNPMNDPMNLAGQPHPGRQGQAPRGGGGHDQGHRRHRHDGRDQQPRAQNPEDLLEGERANRRRARRANERLLPANLDPAQADFHRHLNDVPPDQARNAYDQARVERNDAAPDLDDIVYEYYGEAAPWGGR